MPINYLKESEKYKPQKVKLLLVGEAPPPNRRRYFYVPRAMKVRRLVRKDTSLSATIFNHYFLERPDTEEKYISFLKKLKKKGVFLIDIVDKPLFVRIKGGVNQLAILKIKNAINHLRKKIKQRKIKISDEFIIFLIPRTHYKKEIKHEFPNSMIVRWIDFRLNRINI